MVCPATNLQIGTCPDFTATDTTTAITAASTAFQTFRHTSIRDRARLLRQWHDLIIANRDDLTTLITWENGKPFPEAQGEVAYAASFIEWFSEGATCLYGDTIPVSVPGNLVVTEREPDVESLDEAVDGLALSKFWGTGQTCVCANRIYVHRSCYERFAEKLVERVRAFRVGPGFGDGVTHGPLIHGAAAEKVMAYIEDAKAKGARVLVGGERLGHLGENYVQPTVLADTTHDMRLASEETFGPVAALFAFNEEEEVIGEASRCEVGLAAYIYTQSIRRLFRVAEALEVGMVGANTGIIRNVAAPFGGVKESGFGREGSKYGIDEFTHIKTITIGGLA
ncbi:succinate semialdehyde dehydrogenase [Aspergillus bombycis]|uniref:Succinate-semialdehyde dehydrogenase, mitochondrial n=1 Tax=Aspergillus bombycis TaxID=109264 RepID=A0A1F8A5H6_9EURO|nr:succinate semialdehyde dehydrogenase [Aspergillus bombycis]OGM46992.1 succinate semialdehyde dehydrogenase [Aspergillus bombycis]